MRGLKQGVRVADLGAGGHAYPSTRQPARGENAMTRTEGWKISGEYMESCNCDYLCPCIYTNPQGEATHEHCYALMAFRIERGRFTDLSLDGLKFALVIRSGRVMADGDWVFAGVADAAGDPAQREALVKIVSGEVGGPPARIREFLVSDFRGVEVKPITFRAEGLKRSVEIPDVFAFDVEGVASRNGSGDPLYIDNTAHPANRRLALARASRLTLAGFRLDLSMAGQGNNGHFAPFEWSA